jgi:hypothetical protein
MKKPRIPREALLEKIGSTEAFKQSASLREEAARAAIPVLADLHEIGLDVESLSELRNRRILKKAVPILVKWLPLITHPWIKQAIARLLGSSVAKGSANHALISEFKSPSLDESTRWALGNSISLIAETSDIGELINLATDKRLGRAREMIVAGLGTFSRESDEAFEALRQLVNDPDVSGHAISALGNSQRAAAVSVVEEFANHRDTFLRREARRALSKLRKGNQPSAY